MSLFRPRLVSAWLIMTAGLVFGQNTTNTTTVNNLAFVDPLIGTSNGGNVFPGASLPYGMAKAVADTNSGSNQGGFTLDGSNVTGFSLMHDSGTGGDPSLGNFALFSYSSCPGGDIDRCVFPKISRAEFGSFNNDTVVAEPGYFSITLDSGIQTEMSTTQHASLFKFTFPSTTTTTTSGNDTSDEQHPIIFQDLTDLSDSRQDNGSIAVDPTTGRITGSARFVPSFAQGTYVLYFCTDFSGADIFDNGIYSNSRASTDVKNFTISRSINGYPLPGGAFVRFASASEPIYARSATSFISSAQACAHAEAEIPDFDLDTVKTSAQAIWEEKLSAFSVDSTGVDASFVTNFFSGVYRTMINPQNYTGENPLWSSNEPYFDSFYWYGGSNADNILADGYLKGLSTGIDWDLGYAAVVNDAENEPFDWCCEGRGGLDSWKALDYIPVQDFDYKGFGTMTRSISRTLEYSYNDYCISQIAAGLNNTADQEKYIASSGNWENLYKSDQTSLFANGTDTGYTGFFQPKFLNETWGFQDPLQCSNIDTSGAACSLQNTGRETFESSIWEYSFFVPHNQAELITLFGGPDAFVSRLNFLHDQDITYIGNEPAFLTVFQYHYAGRPGLSAQRSHFYIPAYFEPTPSGLPGNDDSGAMGSFLSFSMLGLFPNPGQDVYLINPPYFPSVNITHPLTGKTATIRNVNFDPTYEAIYIQSATLDGEPYTKNWIDHSFFTEGKELVLTLGLNESSWGTQVADLPPSLSAYTGFNSTVARRMAGGSGQGAGFRSYRSNFDMYHPGFGKL
ncbi:family 92 glycoside hydrolase [Cryphonectria parasitica EP155]|uniref:Family 92 glycoside hydrolase n=1 Tax=Cryphonectria parasitica (strain ATCC 38755 / EP155) TaxID=660469 RepID=A0A9P4Y6K8_CRYP1|nr:family 92 glycoside hydrolase [Cryphonectria parasitica EP155]KAF3767307.1 family 92 glycoside hydrolase [Cryphonectria parasitica EP155]